MATWRHGLYACTALQASRQVSGSAYRRHPESGPFMVHPVQSHGPFTTHVQIVESASHRRLYSDIYKRPYEAFSQILMRWQCDSDAFPYLLCDCRRFCLTFCFVHSVERTIRLNLELLIQLDNLIVQGFQNWVDAAPNAWKVDRFLTTHSPVVVTSCYGQNAAIAIEGNRRAEAAAWDRDRDYSKIAFLTVAIATTIKYAKTIYPLFFCRLP
jgi:hypothetical protein